MAAKRNRANWTRERTCLDCGLVEHVRKDNQSERCRYCAARRNGANGGPILLPRLKIPCAHCGKNVERTPASLARRPAEKIYCSVTCKHSSQRDVRSCVECGKSFTVGKSRKAGGSTNSSGRFCKRSCYNTYLARTDHDPERGHHWKAIRAEALKLTPFCVSCGSTKRLQVHHIVPYRITKDNDQDNLVPLCPKDHKRAEYEVIALERAGVAPWVIKLLIGSKFSALRKQRLDQMEAQNV